MTRLRYTVLVFCGVTAILAVTLTYPFNNDNTLYAYMAQLLLKGHLPYAGSWDQNFPGIIFLQAIGQLLFGSTQLGFRAFDILLQLVGCYLLLRLGRELHSWHAGALAAILAALYFVQTGFWMAGERDTYVTMLLVASLLLTLRGRRPYWVGLLIGLAILLRPTYGLYGITYVAWYLYETRRVRPAVEFVVGGTIPIASLCLMYVATGNWGALWSATILFNLKVYGNVGAVFSLWDPIRFYIPAMLAAIVGWVYLWRTKKSFAMLLLGQWLSSVISLLVLYRHSIYHFHPAMSILVFVSAIGWIACFRPMQLRYAIPIGSALVVLFFGWMTLRGNTIKRVLLGIMHGQLTSLQDCYAYYEPDAGFGYQTQWRVAEYLKQHTTPGEYAQMFGPYSFPQYEAGLLSSSRFQTLHAITMRGASEQLQPFQLQWRQEYLGALNHHPPVYFIVCDGPPAFRQYYGGRLGHEILNQDFTALGSWLQERYTCETKIGDFSLYKRLKNTGGPKPIN